MRYGTAITVALIGAAISSSANADALSGALNSIGVYGEGVGSSINGTIDGLSRSGGKATGGIGVQGSVTGILGLFARADYNYAFDGVIPGVGGHYQSVDLKIGDALPIGDILRIGPYVGYQYADFTAHQQGASASYDNNGLGAGVFVALQPVGGLVFTGNVGYLFGVDASASGSAPGVGSASGSAPSSDVFQARAQGDLRIAGPLYAFAGIAYDRYFLSTTAFGLAADVHVHVVRGYMGLSYSFD